MASREADRAEEDGSSGGHGRRGQMKLASVGFTGIKRKAEEVESSGRGRCKFFQARRLELLSSF